MRKTTKEMSWELMKTYWKIRLRFCIVQFGFDEAHHVSAFCVFKLRFDVSSFLFHCVSECVSENRFESQYSRFSIQTPQIRNTTFTNFGLFSLLFFNFHEYAETLYCKAWYHGGEIVA